MAATQRGRLLTEAHRLTQARIINATTMRLLRIWPLLDPTAIDATLERWLLTAVPIVRAGHDQSTTTAAAYFQQFRLAELGQRLDPAAIVRPTFDATQATAALVATGPAKLRTATTTLEVAGTSSAATGAKVSASGGRTLVAATSEADIAAQGTRRVCSAGCCAFCAMLASRTYFGLRGGAFQAHPSCHCQPETAYREGPQDATRQAREFAALYDATPADAGANGKYNAFRRALEAQRAA